MGFIETFKDSIHGVLHAFDRIILKGYIPNFYHGNIFYYFLDQEGVKLKDFKDYEIKVTDSITGNLKSFISESGCYQEYLRSPSTSKEEIARRVLLERGILEGIICALSVVEPCCALGVVYNRGTGKLDIE